MKKDQKNKAIIIGLAAFMALLIGLQLGGGKSSTKPKPLPQRPAVASRGVDEKVAEPVVVRDVFWHPALAKDLRKPTTLATSYRPPTSMPLPAASSTNSMWVPPIHPDVTALPDLRPRAQKNEVATLSPEKLKPKKVLSVCGFLAAQTPKIILSMNSEDPTPYGVGQKPCPEVTIVEIRMDQATVRISNRQIVLTAGQQVEI